MANTKLTHPTVNRTRWLFKNVQLTTVNRKNFWLQLTISYQNPNKHIQKSVWLIVSTETADQIVNKLQQFFDRNDTLIVLAWNSNRQGLLLKEDWDWINSNV